MEKIIFNNYDLDPYIELVKTEFEEGELDEEDIIELAYEHLNNEAEDICDDLKSFFDDQTMIVKGSVGRWNGTHSGYKLYETWEQFIKDFGKDCDYFKVYVETDDNSFHVECSHHDGTNYAEIKVLTFKGKETYDDWYYDDPNKSETFLNMSTIDILKLLWNSEEYSNIPKYF